MTTRVKREREIKIRLSQDEHNKLVSLSGDLPLAEWLRETGLTGVAVPSRASRKPPPPPVNPALLRELTAQGQNLNQISRQLNSVDIATVDHIRLQALLVAIERELSAIRLSHSNDR
jgi:hypothetical protein